MNDNKPVYFNDRGRELEVKEQIGEYAIGCYRHEEDELVLWHVNENVPDCSKYCHCMTINRYCIPDDIVTTIAHIMENKRLENARERQKMIQECWKEVEKRFENKKDAE